METEVSETQQVPKPEFIPAKESPFFIKIFGWYTKWLFRLRFKHLWVKQRYFPGPDSKTIYFLNHSSWWDGIIPLLLNNYLFDQRARAIMEDKQMLRYKFFQRIGAFSVNLDDPKGSLKSLRYAVNSMKRDNSSLFIYPEGKMVPFSTNKPEFKKGLTWLCKKLPEVDIVPIGIYIHTIRHNKPELHISIGKKIDKNPNSEPRESLQHELELSLQKQLQDLQENAGFDDTHFSRWF